MYFDYQWEIYNDVMSAVPANRPDWFKGARDHELLCEYLEDLGEILWPTIRGMNG